MMKILENLEMKNQNIMQNSLQESKKQTYRSKLLAILMLLTGIGFTVIIGIIIGQGNQRNR